MNTKTRNVKHLEWSLGVYSPNGMKRMKGLGDIKILKELYDRTSQLAIKYSGGRATNLEQSASLKKEVIDLFQEIGPRVWPDSGIERPWLAIAGDVRLEGWYPCDLYYSTDSLELFRTLWALVIQKSVQRSKSKAKATTDYGNDLDTEALFKDIPIPPDDSQDKDYSEDIRITPPPSSRRLRSDRRRSPRPGQRNDLNFSDTEGIEVVDDEDDFPILVGDLPSPISPTKASLLTEAGNRDVVQRSDSARHPHGRVTSGLSTHQDKIYHTSKQSRLSITTSDAHSDESSASTADEATARYNSPLSLNPKHGEPANKEKQRMINNSRPQSVAIDSSRTPDVLGSDVIAPTLAVQQIAATAVMAPGSKRSFDAIVADPANSGLTNSGSLLASRVTQLQEKQERKRQRLAEAIRRSENEIDEKKRQVEEEEQRLNDARDTLVAWLDQKIEQVDEDTDENEEVLKNRQATAEFDKCIEETRAKREWMENLMRELMEG